MKRLLKKLIPSGLLDLYHRALAHLAAARYGHPSRHLIVIGVTGTNGKSTVSNMIASILEESGHKVGLTTTVNFRIAGRDWLNDSKMTMLGRTRLQKLLAEMVAAGCRYAVVETSSEGIKQHRHAGIDYDAAVFTNLTPEHLESHGGFENYKRAKGELFAKLSRDHVKTFDGTAVPKVSVVNLASEHAPYFLGFAANKKYGFFCERPAGANSGLAAEPEKRETPFPLAIVKALDVRVTPIGSEFTVRGVPFGLKMLGLHNVENALAAIAVGLSQGVPLETMAAAFAKLGGVPGRLEAIEAGQDFSVIVDYAPEPESMRKLYEVVRMLPHERVIHVLGSAGGGRDRDRRPVLGRLAAEGADIVVVTNEDPYDDDPDMIIEEVAAGARDGGKHDSESLFKISERGAALEKAVALARTGDLVIVTGKGAEQAICVADGKKIPWDDRAKLREALTARVKTEQP
jgi:UDP-N-acetylmuramoyl-L-alanyl-D-glutamate--2,6-diaminopimelate ligase